jgi:HD-GYP domain-containing protein (c-di-GMP phosphodiesterase class II)
MPQIVAEIEKYSGTQFDPAVVQVFEQIVQREGETLIVNSARQVARMRMARRGEDSQTSWLLFPPDLRGRFALAE